MELIDDTTQMVICLVLEGDPVEIMDIRNDEVTITWRLPPDVANQTTKQRLVVSVIRSLSSSSAFSSFLPLSYSACADRAGGVGAGSVNWVLSGLEPASRRYTRNFGILLPTRVKLFAATMRSKPHQVSLFTYRAGTLASAVFLDRKS